MTTLEDLRRLQRCLSEIPVLSIYLSRTALSADPRDGRLMLEAGLSRVRQTLARAEPGERAEFERASAHASEALGKVAVVEGPGGSACFASAEGVVRHAALPGDAAPLVAWRKGPVLAPFVGALGHARPVIVLLLAPDEGRFYRFHEASLEAIHDEDGPPPAEPLARRRLLLHLADRAGALAASDAWCLVAGDDANVRELMTRLPHGLISRSQIVSGLTTTSPESAIREACISASSELGRHRDVVLIERLLDRHRAGGRAACGAAAIGRAIELHAVAELLISRRFVESDLDCSERVLRAALAMGADVSVPAAESGARLDAECGGLAARLRFPLPEPGEAEAHDAASPLS